MLEGTVGTHSAHRIPLLCWTLCTTVGENPLPTVATVQGPLSRSDRSDRGKLPWVLGSGGALAAGLSVSGRLLSLLDGSQPDHFSLIEHEVQAVADQLDGGEDHGYGAAVEDRSDRIWWTSLMERAGEPQRLLWKPFGAGY